MSCQNSSFSTLSTAQVRLPAHAHHLRQVLRVAAPLLHLHLTRSEPLKGLPKALKGVKWSFKRSLKAFKGLLKGLRVPLDAVGVREDHAPLRVNHEAGAAAAVLPPPLPGQREVRRAVDAPHL